MLVKKGFSLIEVLIVIVLISILGSAGYLVWQNQSGPTPTPTPNQLIPTIQPTTNPISGITWLTYTHPQFPEVTFKYPLGSVITTGSIHDCELEGCFSIILTYDEMEIRIFHYNGVGGIPVPPNNEYEIIGGNVFAGIGRYLPTRHDAETNYSYFEFYDGGRTSGFIANTSNFLVSIPYNELDKYLNISDFIAVSGTKYTLNLKSTLGPFYTPITDKGITAVIGINRDGAIYQAFIPSQNEQIDNYSVNPTGEYLAIKTIVGNGPIQYLYIFEVPSKKLLQINNNSKFDAIGEPPTWITNYQFTSSDLGGKYIYDVKNLTITKSLN